MSVSTAPPPDQPQSSWTDAFPAPRSSPGGISNEELAQIVKTKQAGKDYLVVDVRRTDFEVRHGQIYLLINVQVQAHILTCPTFCNTLQHYAIPSAINLPAHSFYPTLPGVLSILSPIPLVIFHCQSCGKPGSRGRRVAGWYQDALDDAGITTSQARYLEGGIKGWIEKYGAVEELLLKLPALS
jgi:arsenical-resistance protein 2